jgi:hypothetical protein
MADSGSTPEGQRVSYWTIGKARRRFESFDRAVDLRYMAGLDDETILGYNRSNKIVVAVPGKESS